MYGNDDPKMLFASYSATGQKANAKNSRLKTKHTILFNKLRSFLFLKGFIKFSHSHFYLIFKVYLKKIFVSISTHISLPKNKTSENTTFYLYIY